ncbi:ribonuclease inhibitor-like [Mustelus asterias]
MVFRALEESNSQVEKLWLQGISLTQDSCQAFASFLRTNKTVTSLHLKENGMGDEGLSSLSIGLRNSHCKLQDLRLDTTSLGDKGMKDLIQVLNGKQSIPELTFPYNFMTDSSIESAQSSVPLSLPEGRLARVQLCPRSNASPGDASCPEGRGVNGRAPSEHARKAEPKERAYHQGEGSKLGGNRFTV